jgi:hypothetical protein
MTTSYISAGKQACDDFAGTALEADVPLYFVRICIGSELALPTFAST